MAGKVRRKNWKKTKGRKNTNNKSQSKKERRENKTVFGRAKNALARRVQKSSLSLCRMLVIKE